MLRKITLAYLAVAIAIFGFTTFSPTYSRAPTIARAVVAFGWPLMAVEIAKAVSDGRQ